MVHISRRGFVASAGLAAASLTLGARGARSASPLRIGLPAVSTPYVALFYANDQGYFGDVPMEITVFRGGSAAQEALAAGAADVVSIAPPTCAMAAAKGVSQKIIALSGPPTLQGWYMVVPPSGPTDVAGLEGANVGITAKGSTSDFLAAWSASRAGISINMIPLGAGILPALNAGQIQAGLIWSLASFKALASGEVRDLHSYGDIATEATFDAWVASTAAIEGRGDEIKVLLAGIGRAVQELQADRELAMRLLAEYHDESDEQVVELAYSKLVRNMRPDGVIELKAIQGSLDMAALAGITDLPTAEEITDLRLL